MKYWPVPSSYFKKIPTDGSPGSFWENRDDRYHCGIDIYAAEGSNIVSIENGRVIEIGEFTSADIIFYWNKTYFVIIKNDNSLFCKYAELDKVAVEVGELVKSGQNLGQIGLVLSSEKINEKSPEYIQKIKRYGHCSMLHFELYKSIQIKSKFYVGGNWFSNKKPDGLLHPTKYITSLE